jgi:hypothetical protein
MKKIISVLVLIAIALLALPVAAQEAGESLVLDFNRDFGYGGFGGEIQGRFSLSVSAPTDLVRVEYFLDGELVYEGNEPPFKWQFNTANYPDGRHTFTAVGYKADGTEIQAEAFTRVFLSAEAAWGKTGDIIVPILIIVGIATLGGVLIPVLLGRKKVHTPGVYGMAGGAICPRCKFPYSRSVMAPNMVVGKLDRCPHCGKWAIVPRASAEALQAAEERLAAGNQGTIETPSEAEKLRKMVEDSRFEE